MIKDTFLMIEKNKHSVPTRTTIHLKLKQDERMVRKNTDRKGKNEFLATKKW